MRSAAPVSHPAPCILASTSTSTSTSTAPARIHADILTVPGCCLLAGPGLISPSRCLQLCNNWRRAARAAINQNKQHKKTILDIFLSMFDSINWPHSLLKISLHYTSTQISRYLRTHGGLMIKDLLTSSAPRRHGTSPGRQASCNTFCVTPKLFLSHLLLSLYGEVIKQTEVQHAHNCSRLCSWMKSTFITKEIPNQS